MWEFVGVWVGYWELDWHGVEDGLYLELALGIIVRLIKGTMHLTHGTGLSWHLISMCVALVVFRESQKGTILSNVSSRPIFKMASILAYASFGQ